MSQSPSRIIAQIDRVPPEIIAAAARLQPAMLSDAAGRRGALHGRITALSPTMKCAGSAITVEVRPGDNMMIHAALTLARPGDVLVVDGKGDQTCALFGAILTHACRKRGLAGVVIDAAVRDRLEIVDLGFPVFSVGTNPKGPTKGLIGTINHPVSVGGVVVHPGDFVSADADGVVVIGRKVIEGLIPLAEKKISDESARISAIEKGDLDFPSLTGLLRNAGLSAADLQALSQIDTYSVMHPV